MNSFLRVCALCSTFFLSCMMSIGDLPTSIGNLETSLKQTNEKLDELKTSLDGVGKKLSQEPSRVKMLPVTLTDQLWKDIAQRYDDAKKHTIGDSWEAGEIDEDYFFNDIMGKTENAFKKGDRVKYFETTTNTLKTDKGKFLCGKFYLMNVGELIEKSEVEKIKDFEGKGTGDGKFSIYEGQGYPPYDFGLDVRMLQADPENNGAVFEVASNYNALETVDADQLVSEQLLGEYPDDPTQGPSASVSAAPGLIYRRYFLFHEKYPNQPAKWEQKTPEGEGTSWPHSNIKHYSTLSEYQINLLDNLTRKGPLGMSKAAYVLIPKSKAPKIEPEEKESQEYKKVNIGYHAGIQVTYGVKIGDDVPRITGNLQVIDQIFTAAVDWQQGTNKHIKAGDTQSLKWGDEIIKASRRGNLAAAYLASLEKKNKGFAGWNKIFLTIVGGGAFAGIFKGRIFKFHISELVQLLPFIKYSGLHVIFVSFSGFKGVVNKLKGDDTAEENVRKLLDFMIKSGGEYRRYYYSSEADVNDIKAEDIKLEKIVLDKNKMLQRWGIPEKEEE